MTRNAGEAAPSRPDGVDARLARHGGLSYLEISTVDPRRSATFYERVFGWEVDWRGQDDPRFADRSGQLIGRWVTGRAPAREPGLLPYVYVDSIDDAIEQAIAQGGQVVRAPYLEGDTWIATVRDPAGNLIGIWQAAERRVAKDVGNTREGADR
ncbi:MAG: VOC family protein [Chloroflexota bacterium]